MENLAQFSLQIPAKFKDLCELISSNGYKIGVVGGAARDFIIDSKISYDLDCELRPKKIDDFEKWPLIYEKIKHQYPNFEELPYNILRLELGDFTVEVSLPRVERYDGTKGHSNFVADYIADIDYKVGFERRDLTVNSIMFEFNGDEWKLVDPLDGVKDLTNKIIRKCSSHFFFDPVRFLRAIRFALKLRFEIHPDTKEVLEVMDLQGLSSFYLKSELIKSNRPMYMLKKIYDLRSDALDGLHINLENKVLIQYDKLFDIDLEEHLRQSVFLSVEVREKILKKLGFSTKNLIPSIKIKSSWKSLINDSYESEKFKLLTDIINKLERINTTTDRLEYLLNYFEFDLSVEQLNGLKVIKYQLSETDMKLDKVKLRYFILQKRLEKLL